MSFARHQTFYLRAGWLTKAIFALEKDTSIFSKKDAAIELGIGKNMVSSLRFWVRAAGLVEKNSPNKNMRLSRFGSIVKDYDPYFELDFTWWLVHYHIVNDENEATAWYFLFNKYPKKEFDRITFVEALARYSNNAVSLSSYRKDYDCILSTYIDSNSNGTPEDNIVCPLSKFKLLSRINEGFIKKTSPQTTIPLEVVYFVIKHNSSVRTNVSNLLEDDNNIGKVFNLSIDEIYYYLDRLEEKGWLSFSRTAGLDSIILNKKDDDWDIIEGAYQSLNQEVDF
jgi:hypothetical protein